MSVAQDFRPHYTYNDYLQWEGKWEVIAGTAYAMAPAPAPHHQNISANIAAELRQALRECEMCRAYLPLDWKISEDTVVQPDNLVLCYRPDKNYITKAPSLIFEVLSPSTAAKDEHLKFELYEREGVAYYVIVNPDEKIARVYRLSEGRYVKVADATEERVSFELNASCGFALTFKNIWE